MKKQTIITGLALALGVLAFAPSAAQATEVTKEATATFDLTAPESGTLNITEADNLVFESKDLSADTVFSKTTADTKITIQELSGNAPGWKLTAKLGEFKEATKTTQTLAGAQIYYPQVTPTTNAAEGTAAAAALPTTIGTAAAFEGTTTGVVVSAGGEATIIANAAVDKGYGQWTMTYDGDNKVQLKVPGGQLSGSYKADLTYVLTDSPAP